MTFVNKNQYVLYTEHDIQLDGYDINPLLDVDHAIPVIGILSSYNVKHIKGGHFQK